MKKEIAESLSISFHPILLPLYNLLFLFVLPIFDVKSLGFDWMRLIFIASLFITFLIPVALLFFLQKGRIIKDLKFENTTARYWTYSISMIFYLIAGYLLYVQDYMPAVLILNMLIPATTALILLILLRWWKFSAHAAATTAFLGLLLLIAYFYSLDFIVPIGVTSLLSILIIWSRYYLKEHTVFELFGGAVIGFLVSIILGFFYLMKYFH